MFASLQRLALRLSQLEIWFVGFAISLSMAWPRFLPAAVIAAAFFLPVHWLAYQRISVRTPGDIAVLLLTVMGAVTLLLSPDPTTTSLQVFRLLTGIVLYYTLVNWSDNRTRLRYLLFGIVLAGGTLALIAPFTVEWAVGKLSLLPVNIVNVYQQFTLVFADTINPAVLAGSLVLIMPLAFAALLFSERNSKWGEKGILLFALLLMTAAWVLTLARGPWLAFGVASLLVFSLRWRGGMFLLLVAGIVFLSAGYYLGMTPILEFVTAGGAVGGADLRQEIWSRAIYMIQDFPFTGVGMGLFPQTLDVAYPMLLASRGAVHHAHNLFLQIAVDLGLPGLIAWLALLLTVVAVSWQLYRAGRATGDRWLAGLGAGLLGSQAAMVVNGLTDAVVWGMVRSAPIVWAVWGLAMAAWLTHTASQAMPPPSEALAAAGE